MMMNPDDGELPGVGANTAHVDEHPGQYSEAPRGGPDRRRGHFLHMKLHWTPTSCGWPLGSGPGGGSAGGPAGPSAGSNPAAAEEDRQPPFLQPSPSNSACASN